MVWKMYLLSNMAIFWVSIITRFQECISSEKHPFWRNTSNLEAKQPQDSKPPSHTNQALLELSDIPENAGWLRPETFIVAYSNLSK